MMRRRSPRRATALLLLLLAACGPPKIGDDCYETEDCQAIVDGYCAVTGICVAPYSSAGEVCAESGRCALAFDRTICRAQCEDGDDCRDSDRCLDGACVLVNVYAKP